MALQIGVSIDEGTQLVTQGPSALVGHALLAADGDGSALTGLTKTQVGLGNVDNTSDATKNAATATLTNKDLTSATNTYRGATDALAGAVELATQAEVTLGADTSRVIAVSQFHDHWLNTWSWDYARFASIAGVATLSTGGNFGLSPNTGTTPNTIGVYGVGLPPTSAAVSSNQIDWSKPRAVSLVVQAISTTENGIFRCILGGSAVTVNSFVNLARRGIGIDIRDTRLWILTHSGAVLTETDTGYDISGLARILIHSAGDGVVTVYVNGVQRGMTTSGPSIAGVSSADNTMHWMITNGADSASTRWSVVSPIKLILN